MNPFYRDERGTVYNKSCVNMSEIPDDSVHSVVTSPPYFGLRKYDGDDSIWDGEPDCEHEWGVDLPGHHPGQVEQTKWRTAKAAGHGQKQPSGKFCVQCGAWKGQLGGEPTPELYIRHLVQIMREVKRVLRPDGVAWLNIGDSWSNKGKWGGTTGGKHAAGLHGETGVGRAKRDYGGAKQLDMVLIPSMLALALRCDGWYVRSEVIWSKSNPMPESVNGWRWERHRIKVKKSERAKDDSYHSLGYLKPQGARDGHNFANHDHEWQDCPGCRKCDPNGGYVLRKGSWRPTDAHEIVWMLTKTGHYYCDREAVMENGVYDAGESRKGAEEHKTLDCGSRTTAGLHDKEWVGNGKRNLRSVWEISTQPFPGKHFAVYPPRIPELCINASTPARGVCPKCGSPWARVVKRTLIEHDGHTDYGYESGTSANRLALLRQAARQRGEEYTNSTETIGWWPTCSCDAGEPVPATVLDPFAGSGTTLMVAKKMNRHAIGYEQSEKYCKIVVSRVRRQQVALQEKLI